MKIGERWKFKLGFGEVEITDIETGTVVSLPGEPYNPNAIWVKFIYPHDQECNCGRCIDNKDEEGMTRESFIQTFQKIYK